MSAIAKKRKEAALILEKIGVPIGDMTARRRERLSLALLAVAKIRPKTPWSEAAIYEGSDSSSLTTRQVIAFWNAHLGENVSSGSYDDVRRKDLIYLVEAGLVLKSAGKPDANTNNPTRGYGVSPDAADVLRTFGKRDWNLAVESFCSRFGLLKERMRRERRQSKIAVSVPGGEPLHLSPGLHNELQRAIVEEFLPRFCPGAELLYLGDTTKKSLLLEKSRLKELGFFELAHDALPDIVAFDSRRKWLLLIEAVHSSNPISQLRHLKLERMTRKCSAPRVYVSVFKNRKALREWLLEISWETEVWLVDSPDHLIHFDGEKFLGPYDDA